MGRIIDIDEVQRALDRAAHTALHGTREERSGRFLPKKKHVSESTDAGDGAKDHTKDKA